jgi:FkbM family methyltransferase
VVEGLRSYLKRFPILVSIRRAVRKTLEEIRDTYETFAPLPLRNIRTVSCYGLKLRIGNSPAHYEMKAGTFELEEIALVETHLTGAQVFVDIGANIGLYACLARSAGKHTIAIEPQWKNLSLLYTNVSENGSSDVEVYPVGLSDRPGIASLYGVSGTGASLVKDWASIVHSQRISSQIPVTTLDILLGDRFADKKLLIKIDVEGAEYDVLLGASKTIAMVPRPTWLIEICLNEYHPTGLNPHYAAIFELFWQQGYEVRTADRANKLIQPSDVERWINAKQCDSGVINYIFTPSV